MLTHSEPIRAIIDPVIEKVDKSNPEPTETLSQTAVAPALGEQSADTKSKEGAKSTSARESLIPVLVAVFIIVALNFVAFHGSLRGYFLADDFAHVDYLKNVFNGHADLLAKNFYTNWMQTLGTSFYRPFISITLAGDYLFWGANPKGFHISNFVYQTLTSVFLFLSLNCMFPALNRRARFLTAFFSAALFAAHPLHPEVVSWIIARVDSVCTTFLFLSFYLYLLSRQREGATGQLFNVLSLAAFIISLMSKEMAITLPPTIFLYELINYSTQNDSDNGKRTGGWKSRFKAAFSASLSHSAVLVGYLIFRTFALGTVFGGYSGSVGDGLKESIWKRWFQEGCLNRLILPFNDAVTGPKDPLRLLFKLFTAGALVLAGSRIFLSSRQSKSITYSANFPLEKFGISPFAILAVGWCLIALAPTIQVFDITQNLQGGRFVYLATAPVGLLLCSFIFGTGETRPSSKNLSLLGALSIALALALTASYATLASLNNRPWTEASRGVQTLRESLEKELDGKPANTKIAILNLPQHNKGAHMLYNSAMFGVALKPPLSKTDLTERVITFEPVTYGDSNLINRARLKEILADKNVAEIFLWNAAEQKLMPMQKTMPMMPMMPTKAAADFQKDAQNAEPSPKILELNNSGVFILQNSDSLHSPEFSADSTAYDFLDIELKARANEMEPGALLLLTWRGSTNPIYDSIRQIAVPLIGGNEFHKYRFSVGELKSWVREGNITGIRLDTTQKPMQITVKSARLINAVDEIPHFSLAADKNLKVDANGTTYTNTNLGPFAYDATQIKDAASIKFEVSSPDSWFEHYTGTLRDKGPSEHVSFSEKLPGLKGVNTYIDLTPLKRSGFYEIRIQAFDTNGKPVGYVSNPINFQVSENFFKRKPEKK